VYGHARQGASFGHTTIASDAVATAHAACATRILVRGDSANGPVVAPEGVMLSKEIRRFLGCP